MSVLALWKTELLLLLLPYFLFYLVHLLVHYLGWTGSIDCYCRLPLIRTGLPCWSAVLC